MTTALGMALVLGALAGLIAVLTVWRRVARPHPELTRKAVHVGMGLVSLALPGLFADVWPVVTLAVVATGGVLALRAGRFRAGPGAVLAGVGRSAAGEVCFAAGIATLFVLHRHTADSHGHQLVLYVAPLLVLAVADAAAALVGVRYGRWFYRTVCDRKTAEGSAAFLACAFVCTLVPLLAVMEPPRAVLVASLFAWLVMLLEAVGTRGTDNLLLPVGGFLLLRGLLDLGDATLAAGLALAVSLTGVFVASPAGPRRAVTRGPKPSSATTGTTSRTSATSGSRSP